MQPLEATERSESRFTSAKSAVRSGLQRGFGLLGMRSVVWRLGLPEERWFWDDYLGTGGSQWPEEFAQRLDPGLPLQQHLIDCLDAQPDSTVRILDVGSGPLTAIGKKWPDRKVEITAVDPLAGWFAHLFVKHGITPMVRPTATPAERLADRFRESSFDLVHARNCLDHAFDPAAAIGQMLQVVRPGLCVFLEHVVNEGEKEGYRGLHQWNFFRDGRDFCVSGRKGKRNLTRELADRAEVECSVGEDDWVRARLRKR